MYYFYFFQTHVECLKHHSLKKIFFNAFLKYVANILPSRASEILGTVPFIALFSVARKRDFQQRTIFAAAAAANNARQRLGLKGRTHARPFAHNYVIGRTTRAINRRRHARRRTIAADFAVELRSIVRRGGGTLMNNTRTRSV